MKEPHHNPPAIPGIQPTPLSTASGAFGHMSQASFTMLRHIQVQGPSTVAELCKLESATPRKTIIKVLANLHGTGHIAVDTTTKEATHVLTTKGRDKVADPFDASPKRSAARKMKEAIKAQHVASLATHAERQKRAKTLDLSITTVARANTTDFRANGNYTPTEYAPSTRPGATASQQLPSRVGNRLHYPGGRVTDMAGNTIQGG